MDPSTGLPLQVVRSAMRRLSLRTRLSAERVSRSWLHISSSLPYPTARSLSFYYEQEQDIATMTCDDITTHIPMPVEQLALPKWRLDSSKGYLEGWNALVPVTPETQEPAGSGPGGRSFDDGFSDRFNRDSGSVSSAGNQNNQDYLSDCRNVFPHFGQPEPSRSCQKEDQPGCSKSGEPGRNLPSKSSDSVDSHDPKDLEAPASTSRNQELSEESEDPHGVGARLHRFLCRFGADIQSVKIGGKSTENDALNLKPWRRAIVRPELLHCLFESCPRLVNLQLILCQLAPGSIGTLLSTYRPRLTSLCLHDVKLPPDFDLAQEHLTFRLEDPQLENLGLWGLSGLLLEHLATKIDMALGDQGQRTLSEPNPGVKYPFFFKNLCFAPQIFDLMDPQTVATRVQPLVQTAESTHLILDVSPGHRLEADGAWIQIVSSVRHLTCLELTLGGDDFSDRISALLEADGAWIQIVSSVRHLTCLELTLGGDDFSDRISALSVLSHTQLRSLVLLGLQVSFDDDNFAIVCAGLPHASLTRLLLLGTVVKRVRAFAPLLALTNLEHLTVCNSPVFGRSHDYGPAVADCLPNSIRSMYVKKCGFDAAAITSILDRLPRLNAFQLAEGEQDYLHGSIFAALGRRIRRNHPGSLLAHPAQGLQIQNGANEEAEFSDLQFFNITRTRVARLRDASKAQFEQVFDVVETSRNRILLKNNSYARPAGTTVRLRGDNLKCACCGISCDLW